SNPSSPGVTPDPPSVLVQWIVASLACQLASAVPQVTSGALRSTLKEDGPMVTQLVSASQTERLPVPAVAGSLVAPTLVESVNEASALGLARPDASDAVHGTFTLAPYHRFGLGTVQFTIGASASALTMSKGSLSADVRAPLVARS